MAAVGEDDTLDLLALLGLTGRLNIFMPSTHGQAIRDGLRDIVEVVSHVARDLARNTHGLISQPENYVYGRLPQELQEWYDYVKNGENSSAEARACHDLLYREACAKLGHSPAPRQGLVGVVKGSECSIA